MHATPRHGRIALVAFAVLGVVVLLVAVADDRAEPTGDPVTVTLSAAPGGSDHPTITVDPATDLVDHQVVTVHGEGFDPEGSVTLWSGQCEPEDLGACAPDFSEVDDEGTFTRTVGVLARDCRDPAADCRVTVQAYDERAQEYRQLTGGAALAFDPDAPLVAPPTVTIDAPAALSDGDVITIEGDRFRPGESLETSLCPTGSTFPSNAECANPMMVGGYEADADGHVRLPYRATPVLPAMRGGTIDCRRTACTLAVGQPDLEREPQVTASLDFDPNAPLAPRPTAFARLVEGRTLEVQGEGFVPTEEVYATACIKRDGPKQCLFPTTVHATADDDGTVTIRYEPEPFDGFVGVQDCRGARCFVLVWGSAPGGDDEVRAPFALDP